MELVTIGLECISIDCVIGALEEERKQKQRIEIDLEITYNGKRAMREDDLTHVIDYRDLVKACKEVAEKELFLLETFAHNLAEKLLASFPLFSVKLKVTKKAYNLPAKYSFVKLERKKNECFSYSGK